VPGAADGVSAKLIEAAWQKESNQRREGREENTNSIMSGHMKAASI